MSKDKPTVMIIEDETLLLKAVTKKLAINGISTVSCTSGKQSLHYLSELPELPDVIWLDYYLKDMNGLEFMTAIKEHEHWTKIPVIVVSNSATHEKVLSMLALGAKKYILKAEHKLNDIIQIVIDLVNSPATDNSDDDQDQNDQNQHNNEENNQVSQGGN